MFHPHILNACKYRPTVAIMQWRNEINAHTEGLNVLVWHGASRVGDPKELEKYDVVCQIPQQSIAWLKKLLGINHLCCAGELF